MVGPRRRMLLFHAGLALLAVGIMAVHIQTLGRIEQGGGRGWDGLAYSWLLEGQFPERTTSAKLRLAVVALNVPAYRLLGDSVKAFVFMNYVYSGVLALALVLLADAYGAGKLIKTYLIAVVGLSIATFQMFAFYPVLVDLGSYAVFSIAVYCAVRGWRGGAAAATLVSVISREFALAVVLFGIHRDWRLGVARRTIALTYLPALVLYFAWRQFVGIDESNAQLLTLGPLLQNLKLWRDPFFVALFVYFTLTVFGGVSMIVAADAGRVVRFLREESEWLTYSVVIVAAAAAGNADTWRYLAYLIPVAAVVFTRCARDWTPPQTAWLLSIGAVATWLTQMPFQHMDLDRYFRDWFPYYVWGTLVRDTAPALWPVWAWRLLECAAGVWLLAAFNSLFNRSAMTPRRRET